MITDEAPLHRAIKERVAQTAENGTVLVMRSVKNPIRCVRNTLADEVQQIEDQGATLEEIIAKMAGSLGREAYNTGNCESSPIACGQIAGLIEDVKPVKKVVEDMIAEAEAVLSRVNGFVQ
jgi:NAD(P)H-dependent flavin oxidoreductase YrpB (nitropropane dioxygenase family)